MPLSREKDAEILQASSDKSTSYTPDMKVMPVRGKPKRKIDLQSLILLLLSCAIGVYAYGLIQYDDANALVIVPSVITATIGALNIITTKPPR